MKAVQLAAPVEDGWRRWVASRPLLLRGEGFWS